MSTGGVGESMRRPARSKSRPPAKPPGRVRLANDARRAQLIAVGLEAFSTRPYDEISIDDLAEVAGISKGLLYHYFPTKRDFYVAAVGEAAAQLVTSTETPPTMDTMDRLERGLDAYLAFVSRHASAYVTLMRGGVGADPEVARIIDGTRQAFLSRLLEGTGLADPPPALRMMFCGWIGFVEATSLEWATRRDVSASSLKRIWMAVLSTMSEVGAHPEASD